MNNINFGIGSSQVIEDRTVNQSRADGVSQLEYLDDMIYEDPDVL